MMIACSLPDNSPRAARTAAMAGSFALNDTDTGGVILFGLLMGTRPLRVSPARPARNPFRLPNPRNVVTDPPTQIIMCAARRADAR